MEFEQENCDYDAILLQNEQLWYNCYAIDDSKRWKYTYARNDNIGNQWFDWLYSKINTDDQ